MNRVKICLCLVLLLCAFQIQAATWVQGKVVSVSDGDTITVLDDKKKSYRIRLDEIDAPESAQAFGQVAKKKLSDAIYLKPVSVQISGQDNYKRTIGTVWLDRTNINLYMVQNGLAWAYDKYVKHDIYTTAQQAAQAAQIGLWADKNPVQPWRWRRNK